MFTSARKIQELEKQLAEKDREISLLSRSVEMYKRSRANAADVAATRADVIDELTDKLAQSERKAERLEFDLGVQKAEVDRQRQVLIDRFHRINDLEGQVRELKEDAEADAACIHRQAQAIEQYDDSSDQRIRDLELERNTNRKIIEGLRTTVYRLRTQVNNLQCDLAKKNRALEASMKEQQHLHEENHRLQQWLTFEQAHDPGRVRFFG